MPTLQFPLLMGIAPVVEKGPGSSRQVLAPAVVGNVDRLVTGGTIFFSDPFGRGTDRCPSGQ